MNLPDSNPNQDVIRISRDEAMSARVDDMINRQRSMMGRTGIVSRNRSVWYMQNWLLFGLAGALAAFLIWALLEPYYDDRFYIQGSIEAVDLNQQMPNRLDSGMQSVIIEQSGRGWITIRDQQIWLSDQVGEYHDGHLNPLKPEMLARGKQIGVHLHQFKAGYGDGLLVATHVVTTPPVPPPSKALLDIKSLSRRHTILSLLLFPMVAGFVGLAIGAAEGAVCRLPRRAVQGGLTGLLVGLVGGFLAEIPSSILYSAMNDVAMRRAQGAGSLSNSFSFLIQIGGRSFAWGLAGMAMGLGQGIALRSGKLLSYGFVGGVVGGLIGGLLFDPIDFLIVGSENPSSHWSRMVGFTTIGLSVGLMIGIVQLLTRDAWLRMTEGPLAGKEFLFFKDIMTLGSSPKCEIYLFNDKHVAARHAVLRASSDTFEIEGLVPDAPMLVNDRAVGRARLRHGDRITVGRTSFVFQMKQG
jgi:hypothetical protein